MPVIVEYDERLPHSRFPKAVESYRNYCGHKDFEQTLIEGSFGAVSITMTVVEWNELYAKLQPFLVNLGEPDGPPV
jgi:hypothetical protein